MKLNKFLNSKYKSKSSKCLSGHYHPSRLEAGHCNALMADKQSGRIIQYEVHYKFELRVNDVLVTTHYVDFFVQGKDGKWRVEETKGKEMADWVIKKKLFNAIHPEIPYIVIK